MEAEKEDQKTERGSSETQSAPETRSASKLRDLKPEKDPMGAGTQTQTDIAPPASP